MTPSPNCEVPESPTDPALATAVDIARAAAAEEAGADQVGAHVGVEAESGNASTHLFESTLPGYRGWRWAVTVASAGEGTTVTVSEVVLLPGPDALVAPDWVPWQQRVQAGDLGVGDLMPTEADDPRLVPGYVASDDPAVEEVERELGLGRVRVMSRFGRLDATDRWHGGDFGPQSDMARSAPDRCGKCGFYLPLAGSLRAAFGVCGNELAPADGRVVHVEYGCGAHSEVELETSSPVPVADLVYDDTTMDVEPALSAGNSAPAEPEAVADAVAEAPDAAPEAPAETVADPEPVAGETAPAPEASVETPVEPTDVAPTEAEAEATETEPVEAEPTEPESATNEPEPPADSAEPADE